MNVDKGHKGVSATQHEQTTSFFRQITDIAEAFEPDDGLTYITPLSPAILQNSTSPPFTEHVSYF
jgi:hypothetical protein